MKRIGIVDGIETIQDISTLYTDPKHWWNDFSVWKPYFHETDYHYLLRLTFYDDGLTFHRYEAATWWHYDNTWRPIPVKECEKFNHAISRFEYVYWRII